jgi:hypothetical protein
MPFDARHPQIATRSLDSSLFPAALATPKVSPGVLAKTGERFAAALSALHASLSTLGPLPAAQQAGLDAGLAEIARLEGFGLQLQAFARVLAGDAPCPRNGSTWPGRRRKRLPNGPGRRACAVPASAPRRRRLNSTPTPRRSRSCSISVSNMRCMSARRSRSRSRSKASRCIRC